MWEHLRFYWTQLDSEKNVNFSDNIMFFDISLSDWAKISILHHQLDYYCDISIVFFIFFLINDRIYGDIAAWKNWSEITS